ncbi:MAG: hypothetical protein HOH33_16925 [Verrucomicrobia bacterium]|jgi:dihydroorotate dehydrogenase (NAD+) catalytic subunit|nr:hypothetical protein [Verrucomicrobiota bacterium]
MGLKIFAVPEIRKTYDISKSYEWNYRHVPSVDLDVPETIPTIPCDWTYAGLPVASPFAVAAGPLLNSRWIEFYARRGFDILTYKTVRRSAQASYPLPNLVPVEPLPILDPGSIIHASASMIGAWAVSFGMPSRGPEVWREDVAVAKQSLGSGQILSVSVVATPVEGDDLTSISNDYADCAKWAFESGADVVELNFSCPNVSTRDGMLYTQADASKEVLSRIRDAVGDKPLLVKLGYMGGLDLARDWVELGEGLVQGLVMINCIGAKVQGLDSHAFFRGASRGIAGSAISGAVRRQVNMFQSIIRENQSKIKIIAVGGISSGKDVSDYLELDVEGVQIATAAMLDPLWAVKVKVKLKEANNTD